MESSQDEMSFLDHLEALRWHLIRAIIAVLAVGVVAFVCKDFIFQIIFAPKNGDFFTYRMFCKIGHLFGFESAFCAEQLPFTIQSRTMAGQFSAHIWTSIWAGVILAFPYVLMKSGNSSVQHSMKTSASWLVALFSLLLCCFL